MKITNLGMPNTYNFLIKKAVEGFWRKEKTAEDIKKAEEIVLGFNSNVQSALDISPVGDFDIYDRLLRTAVTFGIVPKRFGTPEEANTDIGVYLSIPRGTKECPASPMVKWFNTNYHVIQPEIEGDPKLVKNPIGSHLYSNGQKLALIGPWTLLAYSLNKTPKTKEYFFSRLSAEYVKFINNLPDNMIVQLEEPAFLTHQFPNAYYSFVNNLKKDIHLHVYFGTVNSFVNKLFSLPVQGIGLDFVDGPSNIELLSKFPEDKYLIAGIINGRNVWPVSVHIKNTLDNILKYIDDDLLYISPSCSLLHVPLSATGENQNYSFALEKLIELQAIKYGTVDYNEISAEDKPLPAERFERSRKTPWVSDIPFPTTTIGSFPQSTEIRKTRASWKKGEISDEEYKIRIREFIKEVIYKQEKLGLDILVHGEYERADMVEYFSYFFDGFDRINGAVQSYGTRFVRPPVVTGPISRSKPFTIEWIQYAQSLTSKPVKGILTGPITLSHWSFPREYISREAQYYEFARALAAEVDDLVEAGIEHIQVDEPALREGLPLDKTKWNHYLKHAINAFRLVFANVPDNIYTYTHMCFSEFGDIINEIEDMKVDVYLIEDSKAQSKLVDVIKERGFAASIGLGVYDVHSPRIPKLEEMVRIPEKYSDILEPNRIWINPDCGLKTRGLEAWNQLEVMMKASDLLRKSI